MYCCRYKSSNLENFDGAVVGLDAGACTLQLFKELATILRTVTTTLWTTTAIHCRQLVVQNKPAKLTYVVKTIQIQCCQNVFLTEL